VNLFEVLNTNAMNPFYYYVNLEANRVKELLRGKVQDFVDATIPYIVQKRKDAIWKERLGDMSEAELEHLDRQWFARLDRLELRHPEAFENSYEIDDILKHCCEEVPELYGSVIPCRNFETNEMNLDDCGTGLKFYELVVVLTANLQGESQFTIEYCAKKLAEKIAIKFVTEESFLEAPAYLQEMATAGGDGRRRVSTVSLFGTQIMGQFRDDKHPDLVSPNRPEAVVSCLEAFLDMHRHLGLEQLNAFLFSEGEDLISYSLGVEKAYR